MTPTPGKWQRYEPIWHRQPVTCGACHAESREPGLYGWCWTRDQGGYLLSRCRRCSPVTLGRPSDQTFGAAASRSRGARKGAATTNKGRAEGERE